MQILVQKIFKQPYWRQGFSLIEILVALLLVSLILLAIPSSENSLRHRQLEDAVEDLDRAIRFSANESVLRNTVVRLQLFLDKAPPEYTVEYGPKGNLILPENVDESKLSVDEAKKNEQKRSLLDGQFTKVEEFAEISRAFSVEIDILGGGTSYQKKLIKNKNLALYFYPTGERDEAIVFFTTQDEMAYLKMEAFKDTTTSHFIPYTGVDVAKVEELQQTKMEEIFNQWLK